MTENPVKVLVVDDSALMRNLVKRIVNSDDALTVVGTAMNGNFALQKIPLLEPDVIVSDIEMPIMNGIEFLLERKKQQIKIPVIILSSVALKGAKVTIEALSLGASDFITKPGMDDSTQIENVAFKLCGLLKAYGRDFQRRHRSLKIPHTEIHSRPPAPKKSEKVDKNETTTQPKKDFLGRDWEIIEPLRKAGKPEILAIGISTGGPNALRKVFAGIDPNFSLPILVVQHMPAGFTKEFAESLNGICPLTVKEAEDGDVIKPGTIYIAPGDRHIEVERGSKDIIRTRDSDNVNGHKPSAGVLFKSVAENYKNHAVCLIMTGMGKDGSREIGEVLRQGGRTIAQDESSCVVYGMPRVAIEHNYIQDIVTLSKIDDTINKMIADS